MQQPPIIAAEARCFQTPQRERVISLQGLGFGKLERGFHARCSCHLARWKRPRRTRFRHARGDRARAFQQIHPDLVVSLVDERQERIQKCVGRVPRPVIAVHLLVEQIALAAGVFEPLNVRSSHDVRAGQD